MNKEKVFSAKDLLEKYSSPLNSSSLFNALEVAGLVVSKEYVSSTGSGEIKSYLSLIDDGLKFGLNRQSAYSEKTELRFFNDSFPELLVVAAKAILNQSQALVQQYET